MKQSLLPTSTPVPTPDTFEPSPNADYIIVHSRTHHTYIITFSSDNQPVCSCPGFGFRNTCRHITEAAIHFRQLARLALAADNTLPPLASSIAQDNLTLITRGRHYT